MSDKKKSSWIVTMRSVVTEEVICDDCTREQALDDPFKFSVDERVVEHLDWDITDVNENV